jgi:hypothetical protein
MTQPQEPGWEPADDVNRAKAIVTTVWLALSSESFEGSASDVAAIGDTLFEAMERLSRAEKNMAVYK